jgi:hypothetical protein
MSNPNLDEALRLARAGICMHPCKWDEPNVKKPLITGWQTRATNIASEIKKFWAMHPNAIPGIAMGKSELVAPDLDVKGVFNGVDAFYDLLTKQGALCG